MVLDVSLECSGWLECAYPSPMTRCLSSTGLPALSVCDDKYYASNTVLKAKGGTARSGFGLV